MWDREARSAEELDALVNSLVADIAPQIDCTACAYCCKHFPAGVTQDDIPRLSEVLNLPPDDVTAVYCDFTAALQQGEWAFFCGLPCPFLRDNNLCSIYAHRPGACRDFPPLTPDFRWLFDQILLTDLAICPITFNVFERLKVVLGW